MNDIQTEYDPFEFADPAYAQKYYMLFDAYIELRVRGTPRDLAVIDAFELIRLRVSLYNVDQLGFAADSNPYVKIRFDKVLSEKMASELWDGKKSMHNLLKLIEDPRVRESTRLNAIKELNVLAGITTIDQQGNSKRAPQAEERANALLDVLNSARAAITQH
ncbi:hypothetical protein [Caballeronia sp. DA-9]|uniref:hypothetical protein n=1 Tax=Caballeronia sp. DA-9 TaxID=3436237 RepID=UPI003F67BD61